MKKKYIALLLVVLLAIPCIAYAASGTAKYFVTATLPAGGKDQVNSIRSSMGTMGYSTTYYYLPTASSVCTNIKKSNLWVVHGHGSAGSVQCLQSNGTNQFIYSDAYASGNNQSIDDFDSDALASTNYGLYIACLSGREPDGGENIVHMTYVKGAETVTGFYNNVSMGEWWANYLYANLEDGYTLATAIENASTTFAKLYGNSDTAPSNPENRLTIGPTNKVLS